MKHAFLLSFCAEMLVFWAHDIPVEFCTSEFSMIPQNSMVLLNLARPASYLRRGYMSNKTFAKML